MQRLSAESVAQQRTATVADVNRAQTADLYADGLVTLDEVVGIQRAGLSDSEIIRRLRDTGQVFALTPSQQDYLRNQGVSPQVLDAMATMNQPVNASERISTPSRY